MHLMTDDVLERYVEEFFEAVDIANIDKVWSSWSHLGESFLLKRVTMESGIQEVAYRSAYRGTGHAACTANVRLGCSGMSFWSQTYAPELFELMTLQTEVFQKLEAIVTAGRKRNCA